MLRTQQYVFSQLRSGSLAAAVQCRLFADALAVPRPDSVKPFDPNGPISQLEDYLDEDSKRLKSFRRITMLLGEMDRRTSAYLKNAPKDIHWESFQEQTGYPPELISALQATVEAEKAAVPKPKHFNEFTKFYETEVHPQVLKTQAKIKENLVQCQAKLKDLDVMEAKLDDLTVDELLEKNPKLAQEIKDELESGQFY